MKTLTDALAKLIEALSKLLEKLFSAKTIWFIVIVAALLASLLLGYGNGSLPVVGDCRWLLLGASDLLGLCTFINGTNTTTPVTPGQKQWIGLILLVAIIMIAIKVVLLVIQGLIWVIKWLRDKLFVQPNPSRQREQGEP